jgi:hypothetical protein
MDKLFVRSIKIIPIDNQKVIPHFERFEQGLERLL